MLRRVFTILCVVILFTCVGCQTSLDKIWPVNKVVEHTVRIHCEFGQFHRDIEDNFFGLDKPQEPPASWTYRE